ncbi:tigger transposable element-derived protein 1-like [Procambarus clarkii]|uniref:tigger transposable element-derived protein 1-like n=1 Tax=Procambarus clarkii TaxID=6728 RepID=UPI0037425134
MEEFSFVTLKFLPPNTTPLLQPMDQKIIASFKKLYERALFRRCVKVTDATQLTLKELWKKHFNICSALKLVDKAWQEVTVRTMISGWRKLWPECVAERDFERFQPELEVPLVEEIVSLGLQLGLELDGADVEELVEEHNEELTTDELQALQKEQQQEVAEEIYSWEKVPVENVPSSTIKKMFAAWEELQTFAETSHPNQVAVGCCHNLFNDTVIHHYRQMLKRRGKQVSLDKFLARQTSSEPQPGPSGMQAKHRRESTQRKHHCLMR